MANTLKNTAGAKFVPGAINIQKVLWTGPTTIAHTYNIDGDIAGVSIDAGTCAIANQDGDHNFIPANETLDFKVTQLSSGKLLIFLE
jgi:hypothetical protein